MTAVNADSIEIGEGAQRRCHRESVPHEPFVAVEACRSDSDLDPVRTGLPARPGNELVLRGASTPRPRNAAAELWETHRLGFPVRARGPDVGSSRSHITRRS